VFDVPRPAARYWDGFFGQEGDLYAVWGDSSWSLQLFGPPSGELHRWVVEGDVFIDFLEFGLHQLPFDSYGYQESSGQSMIFQDFGDWWHRSWTCAIEANLCALHPAGLNNRSEILAVTASSDDRDRHQIVGTAVVRGDAPVQLRDFAGSDTSLREIEPGHKLVLFGDLVFDRGQWLLLAADAASHLEPAGYVDARLLDIEPQDDLKERRVASNVCEELLPGAEVFSRSRFDPSMSCKNVRCGYSTTSLLDNLPTSRTLCSRGTSTRLAVAVVTVRSPVGISEIPATLGVRLQR